MAEGEARFGDTVEVRLAKAELARRTAPETLPLAVERLSADVEGFSPDDRVRLYEGLARYARGSDGGRAALELWRKIAAIRKDSLRAWLTTAQLAGEAGDEGGLRTALAEVRRLEGPEGPLGDFVEATWTVGRLAQNPDLRKDETKLKAELDDARTLLTRAGKQRKEWSAVPRALGILESLAGNVSAATEQFLRAYELGDRSVEVVRALVRHHRAQGQPDRAAAVLREAEERTPGVLAAELGREAWQVALENGRIDEAVAITGQLAERSSDFHDRIVHGHVLYTKYRLLPEAERNGENGKRILAQSTDLFRKVAEEAPQEPDAWIALAAHLHRTGDPDA
ncbi:MAG TPA: hypothetical protein VF170_07780, partial [Planctomycetaceae bacterium]